MCCGMTREQMIRAVELEPGAVDSSTVHELTFWRGFTDYKPASGETILIRVDGDDPLARELWLVRAKRAWEPAQRRVWWQAVSDGFYLRVNGRFTEVQLVPWRKRLLGLSE